MARRRRSSRRRPKRGQGRRADPRRPGRPARDHRECALPPSPSVRRAGAVDARRRRRRTTDVGCRHPRHGGGRGGGHRRRGERSRWVLRHAVHGRGDDLHDLRDRRSARPEPSRLRASARQRVAVRSDRAHLEAATSAEAIVPTTTSTTTTSTTTTAVAPTTSTTSTATAPPAVTTPPFLRRHPLQRHPAPRLPPHRHPPPRHPHLLSTTSPSTTLDPCDGAPQRAGVRLGRDTDPRALPRTRV